MSPEIATVIAGGIASWATIMVAVIHRTNGSGPISKKLDTFQAEVKADVADVKADIRELKAEHREHLRHYHVGDVR